VTFGHLDLAKDADPSVKNGTHEAESGQAVTPFPSRSTITRARRQAPAARLIQAQLAPSKCWCCLARGSRVKARGP